MGWRDSVTDTVDDVVDTVGDAVDDVTSGGGDTSDGTAPSGGGGDPDPDTGSGSGSGSGSTSSSGSDLRGDAWTGVGGNSGASTPSPVAARGDPEIDDSGGGGSSGGGSSGGGGSGGFAGGGGGGGGSAPEPDRPDPVPPPVDPSEVVDETALNEPIQPSGETQAEVRASIKEQAADRFTEAVPGVDFGANAVELEETDQGVRPVLDESAQQTVAERQVANRLDVTFDETSITGRDIEATQTGNGLEFQVQADIGQARRVPGAAEAAAGQGGSVDIMDRDVAPPTETGLPTSRQTTQSPGDFGSGDRVDALGLIEAESRELNQAAEENLVDPGADIAGDVFGLAGEAGDLASVARPETVRSGLAPTSDSALDEEFSEFEQAFADLRRSPEEEVADPTTGETAAEGLTRGVGNFATDLVPGGPATAIGAGRLAAGGVGFTARAIEEQGPVAGGATAGAAGLAFGRQVGEATAEHARENPFEFTGETAASFGASAALSPVRFSRLDVPTQKTSRVEANVETQRLTEGVPSETPNIDVSVAEGPPGSTTVRGVRIQSPPLAERLGARTRGRTLFGTRDGRPTLGAPSVEPVGDNLDLSRMGATGTATVEPASAFEADVFRQTAQDIGGEAATRFETAESIQAEAQRRPNLGFTADTAEEAVGQARAVPEGATEEVTQALRDVDATVFGSAAARAQVEDFRQPRDLDVVVPDKAEAKERFGEALEGENADVGEVFDIKETSEVPGRARGGEEIKFGRTSREPRELGGVPFNPVEEELTRKAGAAAFLREPGAGGTSELDIGPEPRRPGRPDVRQKDPEDAATLARELGMAGDPVDEFERAFELESGAPEPAGGELFGDLGDAGGRQPLFGEFVGDTRGQVDVGRAGTRRTSGDGPDVSAPDRRGRRASDTDAGSPVRTDGTREVPAATPSPGSPGPRGGGDDSPGVFGPFGGSSPGALPGGSDGEVGSPSPGEPDSPGVPGLIGPFDIGSPVGEPPGDESPPPGTSPPEVPPVSPPGLTLPSPGASSPPPETTPESPPVTPPVVSPAPASPRPESDGGERGREDSDPIGGAVFPAATPEYRNPIATVFSDMGPFG